MTEAIDFRHDEGLESAPEVRGDAGLESGGRTAVIAFDHLPNGVQTRHDRRRLVRDAQLEKVALGAKHGAQLRQQFRNALAGFGGDADGIRKALEEFAQELAALESINLVEDHQGGFAVGAYLLEHG